MKKYPVKIDSQEYIDTVKINVFCADKCNYLCSYCYNMKNKYKRTNKEVDLDKVYKFACWIKERTQKNIDIILIGGEPTLHSTFKNFVLNAYYSSINIISFTNFSKPYDFFEKTIKLNVKYLISYHYATLKRTNEFITKLLQLHDNNLGYGIESINIMMLNSLFNECLYTYDILYEKYNGKIYCNLIDDCDKDILFASRSQNYTTALLDEYYKRCNKSKLEKHNIITFNDNSCEIYDDYEIKNNIDFNFKLWECDAGKNYFHIDVDGNIYPCSLMSRKKLATLDSYLTIKFKETICLTSLCPCEYGLGKRKIFNTQK